MNSKRTRPRRKRSPKIKSRATPPKRKKESVRSRNQVAQVITQMRAEGVSLRKAARDAKVSPRTVIKKAASALRKNKSGRYTAKTSDRLVRVLMIPTPEGPQEISVRGLRDASLLGRYWIAVDHYYETGDMSVKKFEDQSITAVDGTKYPLLTDLDVLNRLGYAGVFSFESLYARSA